MLISEVDISGKGDGVELILSYNELFIIIFIISVIFIFLTWLYISKNKILHDLEIYKTAFDDIVDQKKSCELDIDKLKIEADQYKKDHNIIIDKLNIKISNIESENYIYLKQLNDLKDKQIIFEKEKSLFLSGIVSKLFGDKTQFFIKMIDSETLDEREKLDLFSDFFEDIIPLIRDRKSSLKNIEN